MVSSHHDESPPERSRFPALIEDYRAQRSAWRAQARSLAQMRADVVATADVEARGIVAAARSEVREVLIKARRDLLAIAAQVQAATEVPEEPGASGGDAADAAPLPADDLSAAHHVLTSARHDIRGVLDDVRPDLEALASEAAALRCGLRQVPATPLTEAPVAQVPRDTFDLSEGAALVTPNVRTNVHPHRPQLFVAAFVVVGFAVAGAVTWWLLHSVTEERPLPTRSLSIVDNPASPVPVVETDPALPQPLADTPLPTDSVGTAASLAIRMNVRRAVWARTTVDGRVMSARLFNAGETQQFDAARDVSIRAGDAGAVLISINGAEEIPLGRDGEVITRVFALDEKTPPAASPQPDDRAVGATSGTAVESDNEPPALPTSPRVGDGLETPDLATTRPDNLPTTEPPGSAQPIPPPAAVAAPTVREQVLGSTERWLAAYYRRDRPAMAALSSPQLSLSDERTERDRLPPGLVGVRLLLDNVQVQAFGDSAIVSARMTERMEDLAAGRTIQSVSFVSLVWTRRAATWQLEDVRVVGEGRMKGIFR
jgi:hypothetical protein